MNEEMIKKAKGAKTVEELLALAKESGIELTEEKAKTYFARLHPVAGELTDDELDNVSGGGCGDPPKTKCPQCGSTNVKREYYTQAADQCRCTACGNFWYNYDVSYRSAGGAF